MAFSLKNLMKGNMKGLSGLGNAQFKRVQEPALAGGFPKTLNKATIWAVTGSDITCTIGKWTRIGEYTVPAQQRVHLGFGVSGGNPEEIGHMHFDIMDDTATNSVAEAGSVRLGYVNASETLTAIIYEGRSEELSATSTTGLIARSDELLLPETPPEAKDYPGVLAQEDSILIVDFKADATDIVVETAIGTGANNIWKLPITEYS